MLLSKFEELMNENDKVVWKDEMDGKFCFGMGDGLMDGIEEEEIKELYERLEKECEENGIEWSVGYGDDVVNCISVEKLEDFDKVEGLEEFVLEWMGENCYSREDDEEDEEDEDEDDED